MSKPHSLDIGSDMGYWPVFHDLAILNHLPFPAYIGLLKFDIQKRDKVWSMFGQRNFNTWQIAFGYL